MGTRDALDAELAAALIQLEEAEEALSDARGRVRDAESALEAFDARQGVEDWIEP